MKGQHSRQNPEKARLCDESMVRRGCGESSKGNVPSCWLPSGLGFLLLARWGTTGEFRAGKWHDICFQGFIFYLSLTHAASKTHNQDSKSSDLWSSAFPTQIHGFSPDLDVLGILFFFCPLQSYLWSPDQILKWLLPVPQAFGSLGLLFALANEL